MDNAAKKQNIDLLDLIKVLATILIVFHHYQQSMGATFSLINFYGGRISFGNLVELFFMISGFVAMYTFKPNQEISRGEVYLLKNLCHKLLRIFPVVTIALIFAIVIKTINYSVYGAGELSSIWNFKTLVANFLLIFRGWPYFKMTGINNPTWYLCILIQCYLIFYLCLYIQDKKYKRTLVWVGIAALSFYMYYKGALDNSSFRGIECFFIGAALCDLFEYLFEKEFTKSRVFKIVCVFSAVVIITVSLIVIIFKFPDVRNKQVRIFIFGVFIWLILIAYLFRDVHSKIIQNVGKISFEVYVWHSPFLAATRLLMNVFGFTIDHSYLTMLLFTAIVWGFAILLWKFVETPINRFIKSKGL